MINKPHSFKGLNLRIPFIIPIKGRGFINQGYTFVYGLLELKFRVQDLGFPLAGLDTLLCADAWLVCTDGCAPGCLVVNSGTGICRLGISNFRYMASRASGLGSGFKD